METVKKTRYGLLDSIRGLVLISMILYHSCWDLVYIFGKNWSWYEGVQAYIWQQSICWTFILLSGFCWSLGKKPFKRGLLVFLAGLLVSLVTIIFMPSEKVEFGVLSCIGSCMLLMIPLDRIFQKIPSIAGFISSILFFVLTRNINEGFLGFEKWRLWKLPEILYQGKWMTYVGFTEKSFFSTDYFSLIPWIFLFISGYFLFRIMKDKLPEAFWGQIMTKECRPLSFLGRHSLIIYLLHQPVAYGIITVFLPILFP